MTISEQLIDSIIFNKMKKFHTISIAVDINSFNKEINLFTSVQNRTILSYQFNTVVGHVIVYMVMFEYIDNTETT